MTVISLTDLPKSVRNFCVVEHLDGVRNVALCECSVNKIASVKCKLFVQKIRGIHSYFFRKWDQRYKLPKKVFRSVRYFPDMFIPSKRSELSEPFNLYLHKDKS